MSHLTPASDPRDLPSAGNRLAGAGGPSVVVVIPCLNEET
ncbi:MAG: hypothetical protein HW376_1263, partial [candidate division NC10 bacterium]|nr:hypothetical protein [candidate division NC10 bacterium]